MTSGGLETGVASPRGRSVVVARSQCRFRHVEWAAHVRAHARAALRQQLLAWAPFERPEFRIVMHPDGAMVWACDADRIERQLQEAGLAPAADWVPEALCHDRPTGDVVRLAQVVEGHEGQCWQRDTLVASRWWPSLPTSEEWRQWLATLRQGAVTGIDVDAVPRPAPLVWRSRPWAEPQSLPGLAATTSALERTAVSAAVAALVGLSAAVAHQGWTAWSELRALTGERDRLAASVVPVAAARERAMSLQAQAVDLAERLSAPQPLEVLQHLSERLQARRVLLRELELSGRQLRIGLDLAPDVARASIVKDLQAGGWFKQVAEVRDPTSREWVSFAMELDGGRPPMVVAAATLAPPIPATPTTSPATVVPTPGMPAATLPAPGQSPRAAPSGLPPGAAPPPGGGGAAPQFPLPTGPGAPGGRP